MSLIERCDLPNWVTILMRSLSPTLLNSYKRNYYLSLNKSYRLTLDTELNFSDPNTATNIPAYLIEPITSIIELKYSCNDDDDANEIIQFFPFRVQKFSKYVYGRQLTCQNYSDL